MTSDTKLLITTNGGTSTFSVQCAGSSSHAMVSLNTLFAQPKWEKKHTGNG